MSEIICYNEYVYTKMLNLNLRSSIDPINDLIKTKFANMTGAYKGISSKTTKFYENYNVLTMAYDGLHELYEGIRKTFHDINPSLEKYYIQGWFNYYEKGDYIDWHDHWSFSDCWHGFYCVDCEPSFTRYRLDYKLDKMIEFDIESKNGLLVMSKSDRDIHRTFPWDKENPRVTIAFDIIPRHLFKHSTNSSNWIPI